MKAWAHTQQLCGGRYVADQAVEKLLLQGFGRHFAEPVGGLQNGLLATLAAPQTAEVAVPAGVKLKTECSETCSELSHLKFRSAQV